MNNYLCKTCANKDEAYIPHGSNYRLEEICIYDKGGFPRMVKCPEYTPDVKVEE